MGGGGKCFPKCASEEGYTGITLHALQQKTNVVVYSKDTHCMKSVQYWLISGPYFPVFGVNPGVNSAFGHFSLSDGCSCFDGFCLSLDKIREK